MNLYEIPVAMQSLIDLETGEIADSDVFSALAMEQAEKIEGLALAWKNADAMEAALTSEKKAFEERIAAKKRAKERIVEYLKAVLNGENFETPKCRVSFRKTPESVRIEDGKAGGVVEWLLERYVDCVRFKQPEIDKTALKALVKDGTAVPGVTLESGVSTKIV